MKLPFLAGISFIVKKSLFLLATLQLLFLACFSQGSKVSSLSLSQGDIISATDLRILKKKEDTLKGLIRDIFTKDNTSDRMRSDSLFIRTLVRSLQVKNSFYYPFDSLQGTSHLYAPDSSFRIFTWQISYDNDYSYTRQHGAIQFRTPDGRLALVPLKDYSEFADNPMDSVRNKDTWIGAVYYNIIETGYNGKNYYTLFGYDANSYKSNKKWIEVLTFDDRHQPVFGGKYFSFEQDSVKRATQYRYGIEYKKEAATTVNYSEDNNMIVFDHLISETDEPDNPWTYIPDGDYEGFKWEKGKWVHVDKVFTFKLKDGEFPMPDPIKDAEGKSNEEKLQIQSEKNRQMNVKRQM
ncbi:MAG: hypothetical protein ACM3VS_11440 [Candidatus Dadabacteria bacterium]